MLHPFLLHLSAFCLCISPILLYYFEVDQYSIIKEELDNIIYVNPYQVDENNINKQIFLFSTIFHSPFELSDSYFNLTFPKALQLSRIIEYCQWIEYKTDDSVYYEINWSKVLINSSNFLYPLEFHNPIIDIQSYQKTVPYGFFSLNNFSLYLIIIILKSENR